MPDVKDPLDRFLLTDKVALVTGGSRGLGKEMVLAFAAAGAHVVIASRKLENCVAVAEQINRTTDRQAMPIGCHVGDWQQIDAMVDAVHERFGRIDVLVNNAGVFEHGKLLDTTLAQFQRIVTVNQVGVFLGMKAVAPAMITQGAGSIVNISSIAGLVASAGAVAYGATKFAVRGMTKSVAIELARHGVRVNSIHPGMIETDMMTEVTKGNEERHDRIARSVPLRRAAEAGEVASLALFLASDESAYCTGSEFVIDGGVTAS